MRVLITGGAGFIGSNLVDQLLADGHEVAVADDFSTGRRENLPREVSPHEVDISGDAFDSVVAQVRPDAVAHFAAQIDVRRSVADPVADARINVLGTIRVARSCRRHGVKRLVFASTGGAIYGEQEVFPASEAHREQPLSPYGVAKLSAEHYLRCLHQTGDGPSWCATRFANVYGPRQDPHGEAGVVAIFTGRLLAGNECLIYGDGGQTRDYVYVGDVVRAARDALLSDYIGPVNVGTGIETDVNELYAAIARACSVEQPARQAEARLGEQRRSVIDPALAGTLWGWRPEVSLVNGLAHTVEHFRNQGAH
ncbi:MAG: NAD-dependent epimerase/dehydratase family protein [candidate division Zixibacteria bacterium]|nr:NAD-dependent epimerase/dehydratase family protein [candidate division Zixibacteria bacterium]